LGVVDDGCITLLHDVYVIPVTQDHFVTGRFVLKLLDRYYNLRSFIATIGIDGSNRTRLTGTKVHAGMARWSPDGTRIAYAKAHGKTFHETYDLHVMDANGANKKRLTSTVHRDEQRPAWSPDGQSIAFESFRGSHTSEIGIIHLETGMRMALTDNDAADFRPLWSPDGSWIAFVGIREDGEHRRYHIMVIRPDGTEEQRVSVADADHLDHDWAPSGNRIVYTSCCEWPSSSSPDSSLYVVDIDTMEQMKMTDDTGAEGYPNW
jgi:TolB protein